MSPNKCPRNTNNSHFVVSCYSRSSIKFDYIYGYCRQCEVFILVPNFIEIPLSITDSLDFAFDLRTYFCTNRDCEGVGNTLKNIWFSIGSKNETLKSIITCANCKNIFYYKDHYFWPFSTLLNPIYVLEEDIKRRHYLSIGGNKSEVLSD